MRLERRTRGSLGVSFSLRPFFFVVVEGPPSAPSPASGSGLLSVRSIVVGTAEVGAMVVTVVVVLLVTAVLLAVPTVVAASSPAASAPAGPKKHLFRLFDLHMPRGVHV